MVNNNHALTSNEIEKALLELKGWEHVSDSIKKKFLFDSYLAGVDFIKKCAKIAEDFQHHPEITLRYKSVEVYYTTHDVGNNVSMKDIVCAKEVNNIEI